MIKHMLAILLVFTMHVATAQEVTANSKLTIFSEPQENIPLFANYTGCGGCGPNRPSMAELLQGVQLVLRGGILLLPEVQPLIAQQVLISNLSNPLVIQTLAQIIAASGIGGPPKPVGPAGPPGATGATGPVGPPGPVAGDNRFCRFFCINASQ